ncbi:MerR family transcriptional regulator [Schleiferilactobacillus perolens]|jgi:DNA-binding transcriptional MerR regulator|uniref:MerR family transcriptional regulator n=1 Tax=Schleiferilactobacillus perolens TaxID=100468 RepID=UPI00235660E2|nr:MerR family transcriptional regulator [Schleiferilactobacillus perolens]MCI2170951.1 MerR family transcriptional regulator [Schleiferilactobacillus perolens]
MATYTISEVAQKYNMRPSTLRYYEDLGLLYNVPRKNGHRVYTDQHLSRLSTICCYKNAGMSLDELAAFFHYSESEEDVAKTLALLDEVDDRIQRQITELQANYQQIQRKKHYFADIQTALTAHQLRPKWEDYRHQIY